jgi:hypothetical protein
MSDVLNVFLEATRQKLRFEAQAHSNLSVEQLWDLPLQTTRVNQSDLDSVGKVILRELRQQEEESLITPANNAPKKTLQLKLEVVKAIIETKQAETAAKVESAARESEGYDQRADRSSPEGTGRLIVVPDARSPRFCG